VSKTIATKERKDTNSLAPLRLERSGREIKIATKRHKENSFTTKGGRARRKNQCRFVPISGLKNSHKKAQEAQKNNFTLFCDLLRILRLFSFWCDCNGKTFDFTSSSKISSNS
jgi:hypothetical protein